MRVSMMSVRGVQRNEKPRNPSDPLPSLPYPLRPLELLTADRLLRRRRRPAKFPTSTDSLSSPLPPPRIPSSTSPPKSPRKANSGGA